MLASRRLLNVQQYDILSVIARYVDQAKIHVSGLEQLWPPLKLNSKSTIASLLVEAIMTNENRFLALSNLFILAKSDSKINSILSEWIAVYADCLGKLLRQSYKIQRLNQMRSHTVLSWYVSD